MRYYKLTIAYDGTDYQGWQAQKDVPTITNELQNTFKRVFKKNVSIIGASRTDAGVHALGQIARIKTNLDIPEEKILAAWNQSLPNEISIKSLELTNEQFHPIKNVKEKTYYYHFFLDRPLPFMQRYGYYHRWDIDLDKLKKNLNIFVGTHDFRSFSTGPVIKTSIRTINEINLEYFKEINIYRITIKGKSFLHHMIRRIVGACFEIASIKNNLDENYLHQILQEKNPNQALPNAPAKGLVLYEIIYNKSV